MSAWTAPIYLMLISTELISPELACKGKKPIYAALSCAVPSSKVLTYEAPISGGPNFKERTLILSTEERSTVLAWTIRLTRMTRFFHQKYIFGRNSKERTFAGHSFKGPLCVKPNSTARNSNEYS